MNQVGVLPLQKEISKELAKKLQKDRQDKNTVAIVGFAPTTRLIAPYDDQNVEIWGLNEAYAHDFMKDSEGNFRATRWFQIHFDWSYKRKNNRNDPNHWLWLQNKSGECAVCEGTGKIGPDDDKKECPDMGCDGGKWTPYARPNMPIITQVIDPDIPGSQEFPYNEIMELFCRGTHRGEEPVEYFTSSFAWQAAYAAWLHKDNLKDLRIEVYGYEMSTLTEYSYQKGSTEWWLGKLDGMGVDIYVPEHCQLLKGAKYGWEVTQLVPIKTIRWRLDQVIEMEEESVKSMFKSTKQREATQKRWQKAQDNRNVKQVEKFEPQLAKRRDKEVRTLQEANTLAGSKQELQILIDHMEDQFDDVEEQVLLRQELEFRQNQLKNISQESLALLNGAGGKRINIQEVVSWIDKNNMQVDGIRSHLMSKHQGFVEDEINLLSQSNAISGAMQEIEALIGHIDTIYDYFNAEVRVPLPQVIMQTEVQGAPNGEGQETQETEQGSDTHSEDEAGPPEGAGVPS